MIESAQSVPILNWDEDGKSVCVKITSAISMGKRQSMDVTDLETGKAQRMIVNTVLCNELCAAYPNADYVGHSFQIRKFKPQDGKRYFTFQITEIEVVEQGHEDKSTLQCFDWVPEETRNQIQAFFTSVDEAKERLKLESSAAIADQPADWWKPSESECRDEWYTGVYLKSKQWQKIKKRVTKRDGKFCRRCGGQANAIHHRSYADEVMMGNDDDQLASICEGCHTFIHYDDVGNKRSMEETDRLLLLRDESKAFPAPKVDLRTKRPEHPAQWKRMSAVQRTAWNREHERLWWLGKAQRRNDPKYTDRLRAYLYGFGMDDNAIDVAVQAGARKRKAKQTRALKPVEIRPSMSADMIQKRMLAVARNVG
jgi:hypothetical protein